MKIADCAGPAVPIPMNTFGADPFRSCKVTGAWIFRSASVIAVSDTPTFCLFSARRVAVTVTVSTPDESDDAAVFSDCAKAGSAMNPKLNKLADARNAWAIPLRTKAIISSPRTQHAGEVDGFCRLISAFLPAPRQQLFHFAKKS